MPLQKVANLEDERGRDSVDAAEERLCELGIDGQVLFLVIEAVDQDLLQLILELCGAARLLMVADHQYWVAVVL